MLATIINILDTTAANKNMAEADQQKAVKMMCYLAECLATFTSLVDPSVPSMNNVFTQDVIPRGESGCRRRPSRTLLLDITKGLAC